MKEDTKNHYKLVSNIKYAINMLANKDKVVMCLLVISVLVEMFISLAGVYFPKFVIEQIGLPIEPYEISIHILFFAVLIGILNYIGKFLNTKINWYLVRIQAEYIWDLYMHSITCSYMDMASAKGQNKYQRAKDAVYQGDLGCIKTMIPALLNISIGLLGTIVYALLLLRLNWWIPIILIGLSLVSIFVSSYSRNYEQSKKDNWVIIDKKLNYFINKCSDPKWGKDIRLFSMQKWLFAIMEKYLNERAYWYKKVETRRSYALMCNSFVVFMRDGMSYVYLILCVIQKQIGISDFVLYFSLIATFSQWITRIAEQISVLGTASNLISDFRGFMELNSEYTGESEKNYRNLDNGIKTIEFRNVSFSYDGERNILEDLNLVIKKGEKLGLVGINGAGKTTFVNLICGLFEQTQGQILINGFPKLEYDPVELRKEISTVFQDASVFPFTVAENISMREKDNTDIERVLSSIKTADLSDKVNDTEKGIDSTMLKITDNKGILMSGGEIQKLYLARAIYKNGSVIILDEPTAALDPISERKQYLQYERICKDKITIYISHRLASTSFCDKIVFLENGKIIECGSHDELMKLNGKYHNMFEVQREYYKEDDKNDVLDTDRITVVQ
ncbi:MAG: ABC transporter ATP-binding protein [Lachnospiraceae bacterium]|nr:ABC transporter ATP-binding protein [Lachnospiraceae bacterium]